jgi:hypothetical protein
MVTRWTASLVNMTRSISCAFEPESTSLIVLGALLVEIELYPYNLLSTRT